MPRTKRKRASKGKPAKLETASQTTKIEKNSCKRCFDEKIRTIRKCIDKICLDVCKIITCKNITTCIIIGLFLLGAWLLGGYLKFSFYLRPILTIGVASALAYIIVMPESRRLKIILTIIAAILAAQVVAPVFIPKISISETEFLYGYLGHNDAGALEYWTRGTFEVKVRPPLFPINKYVEIPIENVRWADYTRNYLYARESDAKEPAVNSILFPDISINRNKSIRLNISKDVDGWTYDELKTKIDYEAYQDPRRMNATVTPVSGNIEYNMPVNFTNNMDFRMNFEHGYRLDATFYDNSAIPKRDYYVRLCDRPQRKQLRCDEQYAGECCNLSISTDKGTTFKSGSLSLTKFPVELTLKLDCSVAVGTNTLVERYIVLAPCG